MSEVYSRREFLGTLGRGALALGVLNNLPKIYGSEVQGCDLTLDRVKSGEVSPEDYLSERAECLPNIVNSRRSGMLKGLIYEPSTKELVDLIADSFSGKGYTADEVHQVVRATVESYRSSEKDKSVATVIPNNIEVFGRQFPHYIVVKKNAFENPSIVNDADMRSLIAINEIQHVRDFYNGITLDDVHLSHDTISPANFRLDYLARLMKLRATHEELDDIFMEKIRTDKISVSPEWFSSQAGNYYNHWNFIENYDVTDMERRVRDIQFEDYRGMIPTKERGGISINFKPTKERDAGETKELSEFFSSYELEDLSNIPPIYLTEV